MMPYEQSVCAKNQPGDELCHDSHAVCGSKSTTIVMRSINVFQFACLLKYGIQKVIMFDCQVVIISRYK